MRTYSGFLDLNQSAASEASLEATSVIFEYQAPRPELPAGAVQEGAFISLAISRYLLSRGTNLA